MLNVKELMLRDHDDEIIPRMSDLLSCAERIMRLSHRGSSLTSVRLDHENRFEREQSLNGPRGAAHGKNLADQRNLTNKKNDAYRLSALIDGVVRRKKGSEDRRLRSRAT